MHHNTIITECRKIFLTRDQNLHQKRSKRLLNRGMTFQKQALAIKQQIWSNPENVAILVDGVYLYKESKKRYGRKVDCAALMREAVQRSQMKKAIFFIFDIPASEKKALEDLGYKVWTKPFKVLPGGRIKCNFDGEIITEMLDLANNGIHKIVLVAGDSDFESPVKYLKNRQKKVRVIGIKGTVARELRRLVPVQYIDKRMLISRKQSGDQKKV